MSSSSKVVEALPKATSIQVCPETLNNPDALAKLQKAQGNLGGALNQRPYRDGLQHKVAPLFCPRFVRVIGPFTLLCCLWWVAGSGVFVQSLWSVPLLSARVMGVTSTLGVAQKQSIEIKLATLNADPSAQVVILIASSTAPEDIPAYSQRAGDAWKLDRKDVSDAVIWLVDKDVHKLRVEIAIALERAIPGLLVNRVIIQTMAPL